MRVAVSIFRPRVTRQGRTTVTKIWHAAWRDPQTGRRKTKTTGTANKQSAQLFATRLQDQLYRQSIGAYDPAEEHTDRLFEPTKDEYITEQTQRLRPDSVEAYGYSLKAFERLIKPQELRAIDERTIQDFAIKRLREVVAPTVNKDLRQVRAFLRWCRRRRYIARIIEFKGLFLTVDEAEPVWVADADVKAVLKALDDERLILKKCHAPWWRVFVQVAMFCGTRRSETLGLRWADVDFATGTVKVRRQTSKGRRDRAYEGAKALTTMLKAWHDTQPEPPKATDAVLPVPCHVRSLYDDWDRILKHAKIPPERRFTPHDCRSSCVSELLAQGVAITSVRDWVGHASVKTTERFYAATRADRRKVAGQRKVV